MSQELIDKLPEHLKGFKFEPWHFYKNLKAKKGENQLILNDCFIDEVMRVKNIDFTPEITARMPYKGDGLYIEATVTVRSLVMGKERKTIAISSMTKMPFEGGQTHFAQLVITRALKTAVIRHLQISDHDIELVIEAYEIKKNQVTTKTRNITDDTQDDEENESHKTPQVIEPDIDMNLGI
jgi:hypothetical protein